MKFVCYPQEYSWWRELFRSQPSPFVKTINGEIYKTWNGEALINFKWNSYGKRYYILIWMEFFALLGCFIVAATLSKDYISDDFRKQLFKVSILLGVLHFIYEIRQFIYDPKKWIINYWNIIGM